MGLYSAVAANLPSGLGTTKCEKKLLERADPLSQQAMKALQSRGLTLETIDTFRLGVTNENGGRITIPIWTHSRNANKVMMHSMVQRSIFEKWRCEHCEAWISAGEMIPFKKTEGRRIPCPRCQHRNIPVFFSQQAPRYMCSKEHNPGRFLYGAPLAELALQGSEEYLPLLVVEGFESVWACAQAGYPGVVGVTGKAGLSKDNASRARNLALSAREFGKKKRPVWVLMPGELDNGWEHARPLRGLCPEDSAGDCGCQDVEEIIQTHGAEHFRSIMEQQIEEQREANTAFPHLEPLTF